MKTLAVPFAIGDIIWTWMWKTRQVGNTELCKRCGTILKQKTQYTYRRVYIAEVDSIEIRKTDGNASIVYNVRSFRTINGKKVYSVATNIAVREEMFSTEDQAWDRVEKLR